jgi:hypothetical protein
MGINKPIKCGLRKKWEEWMVGGEVIVNGQAREPYRKMVTEWLMDTYNNVPETIGINVWKKMGYGLRVILIWRLLFSSVIVINNDLV